VVDDTDRSITLLLVEDNQNDVESTLAVLSEGRPIEDVFIARDGEEALEYLLRTGAYRAQAAENPKAGLPGLNHQPSSAAEREL
jgi:CheY-like chemotaxis protein